MKPTRRRPLSSSLLLTAAVVVVSVLLSMTPGVQATEVTVSSSPETEFRRTTMLRFAGSGLGSTTTLALPAGFEQRTFWDLSGVIEGVTYGRVADHCPDAPAADESLRCSLLRGQLRESRTVRVGDRYDSAVLQGAVVAEGILLLPSGPREVLLHRESFTDASGELRRRYRFVEAAGRVAATLEGREPEPGTAFRVESGELVLVRDALADNGITIPYPALHAALTPGATGFLQYSVETDTPLTDLDPSWTSVPEMIATDAVDVDYQPDPGDPSSEVTLPEVWDFSGLPPGLLDHRTFNTTRDDPAGASCFDGCTARDVGETPADGTWQAYLKIDRYGPGGTLTAQDYFALNDNDTGADPSIDVPFTARDVGHPEDWTQVCFEQSAGGNDRFLRFFRFSGATPESAVLGVGDSWTSGVWNECDDGNGLRLTLSGVCGEGCYPSCSTLAPRARGRLGDGAGFRMTAVEDGFIHVPAGNYLPALLLRQDTDLLAGVDFITTCQLGSTALRAFDYFWVSEQYGLLALVSSPSDETITGDDWTAVGNVTDGADFTWGPYPPYQIEAQACLAGTRIDWALPADGSNLGGEPGITDWGYVVSWGDSDDAEALADWDANGNRTALPGEEGYLAAPAGSEPTSITIQGWPGAALDATVVTALRYTDPDVGDVVPYRSAALFKVRADPAQLSSQAFNIGFAVAPFVDKAGDDLLLSWPARDGASGYHLKVFDLASGDEIACPAGLDCDPATSSTTHVGGASAAVDFGYRVQAVDPCGSRSRN